MKIVYELELKPFIVPNFVIPVQTAGKKQDGFKPSMGIPLSDIPIEDLAILCKDFTDSVMMKAGYPVVDNETKS